MYFWSKVKKKDVLIWRAHDLPPANPKKLKMPQLFGGNILSNSLCITLLEEFQNHKYKNWLEPVQQKVQKK